MKVGDRYVPRDSEAARTWQEYRPGSRDAAEERRAQMREAAAGTVVS